MVETRDSEQENQRMMESSNVDDRTQHEIYVAPFLRSVMAGLASVMCSYNLVNGTYACENNHTLNGILKNELGFQGFVMSDWTAQHSTMGAMTGLDMSMPGDISFYSNTSYFGANLTVFVEDGTIPEARVDDMATRILASWYFLGQDSPDYPKTNFNALFPLDEATNEHVDVQDNHGELVREIGTSSIVLLKNGGVDGVLAVGWGSGSGWFTYKISPYEAFQARARVDHTSFSWFFDDFNLVGAAKAAVQQDVAMVFIQSDSGEGYITVDGNAGDRKNLTAWLNGDALVQEVASQNNNTIVVVNSVGPLILEPWSTTQCDCGRLGRSWGNGNGLFVDYRHFDAAKIAPRFEFGFGMSYTEFEYSCLSVTPVEDVGEDQDGQLEQTGLLVNRAARGWLVHSAMVAPPGVHGVIHGREYRPSCWHGGA
ncbi:glycoside hydrolase superfamily [Russula vinacea]|nr:glycoside hydrolase superfamily [Russula vinacea]